MSSIKSRASIAAKHSSSPGAATEPGQGASPLLEQVGHLPFPERAPHDHHDVQGRGQLTENCAKTLTNQATRTAALDGVANLPRRGNAQTQRRALGATLRHEDQAVSVDTETARLDIQEFDALADAVGSRRSSGPSTTDHSVYFS